MDNASYDTSVHINATICLTPLPRFSVLHPKFLRSLSERQTVSYGETTDKQQTDTMERRNKPESESDDNKKMIKNIDFFYTLY